MTRSISSNEELPPSFFGMRVMYLIWNKTGFLKSASFLLATVIRTLKNNQTLRRASFCVMLCMFGVSIETCQAQPYAPGFESQLAGGSPWDARQRQYYEQVPADRGGFYEEVSPLDRFLQQVAAQSWIQVDYLLWNLGQNDEGVIGEEVLNVEYPQYGYGVFDRATGTSPTDSVGGTRNGYAPTMGIVDLNSMNGLRLKYGLKTTTGALEASTMWIFQTDRSASQAPFVFRNPAPSQNPNITTIGTPPAPALDTTGVTAIPFLRDSAITNSALIFDTSYAVDYSSSMFGTEINYLWDDDRPINGFHLNFLLGARYLKLDETMTQIGVDSDVATDANNNDITYFRTATIASEAINQLYGPQIGFRMELVEDRVTFGAQPALTLAVNHIDSRVSTNNLFQGDDPTTTTVDESTAPTTSFFNQDKLSPIFSLALYSKIRLFENVQLYASYDLLFLYAVSRPGQNVIYDDDGDQIPDIYVDPKQTNMLTQGLTVGTIFEF
ncbi:BBP7 family outer membrane beta-barrel protein [Rubinisphaera italica]|nr:BBP7 family outer membrane beta-barrel protein [Rubinisphaera italica]